MPQLDAERREVAESIRRDRGIENALTSAQARLFVRCLQTSWQVPPIAWTQRESQAQLQDALRLMHGAEIYRELEGAESPGAIECYRRAGELLEWLARAGDDVTALAPVSLYAAGAYQLGGLPAMATSLLRQAEQAEGESRLYAAFLRADFDAVLSTCANFWQRHPQLTAREGSVAILTEDRDDQVAWYLVVGLVRAIGLIADSLRRGDVVRLEQATRRLKGIEALAARSTGEEAWILLSLLRATAITTRRPVFTLVSSGLRNPPPCLNPGCADLRANSSPEDAAFYGPRKFADWSALLRTPHLLFAPRPGQVRPWSRTSRS
jgi:hypothetical protein